MGIYFEWPEDGAPPVGVTPPISLDLSPETSTEEFRRRVAEVGGRCEIASDLMYEDDAVLLVRVMESGVVGIWDEHGRMTCLSSEPGRSSA